MLRSASGYRRWLTQSCTWNWIQAAARTLSERAGMNLSLVRSSVLTRIGSGRSSALVALGMFRPNVAPDSTHPWHRQVVVRAIVATRRQDVIRNRGVGAAHLDTRRPRFGVDQVVALEPATHE